GRSGPRAGRGSGCVPGGQGRVRSGGSGGRLPREARVVQDAARIRGGGEAAAHRAREDTKAPPAASAVAADFEDPGLVNSIRGPRARTGGGSPVESCSPCWQRLVVVDGVGQAQLFDEAAFAPAAAAGLLL